MLGSRVGDHLPEDLRCVVTNIGLVNGFAEITTDKRPWFEHFWQCPHESAKNDAEHIEGNRSDEPLLLFEVRCFLQDAVE